MIFYPLFLALIKWINKLNVLLSSEKETLHKKGFIKDNLWSKSPFYGLNSRKNR